MEKNFPKIKSLRIASSEEEKEIANATHFVVIEKGLADKINIPYLVKDGKEIEILAKNKSASIFGLPLGTSRSFSLEQVTKITLENSIRIGDIIIDLIAEFNKEFPETEWELLIPKYCVAEFYENEEDN